jgi:hypothetical protein
MIQLVVVAATPSSIINEVPGKHGYGMLQPVTNRVLATLARVGSIWCTTTGVIEPAKCWARR